MAHGAAAEIESHMKGQATKPAYILHAPLTHPTAKGHHHRGWAHEQATDRFCRPKLHPAGNEIIWRFVTDNGGATPWNSEKPAIRNLKS
jgi:hypothetical protein